jgi:uncharacterized protein
MRFLPREEKFYTFFIDQLKVIEEAALTLSAAVRQGGPALEAASVKLVELEQKGDKIIHELLLRLNSTFITPLDPEDIASLASHLDDVLDGIEEATHRLRAYKLSPIPPVFLQLCGCIEACTRELSSAFLALSKNDGLLKHCIEINNIEEQADQLARAAIEELFDQERDPIRLIKVKEIVEVLEETTDACEDVADVLQTVLVKNS